MLAPEFEAVKAKAIDEQLPEPDRVFVVTAPKTSGAACLLCDRLSGRARSRFGRTLVHLPW